MKDRLSGSAANDLEVALRSVMQRQAAIERLNELKRKAATMKSRTTMVNGAIITMYFK